jgi:MraZ protein
MYFRGRILRNPDPKGRLMLPPEFREVLVSRSADGRLVLTTHDDGCIVAYPFPEWEEFEHKINRIGNPSLTIRNFRRKILGGAEEAAPDAQGRIRLSRNLMEHAGIDDEAIIVGQGPRFEIWSPARFAPILEQKLDDVAAALAESGIDFEL